MVNSAKIAIITDTDSSLPTFLANEHNIHQVPIGIHFDQESYTTGLDIDDHILFEKVDQLNRLPTTSAPNPADFINLFQMAFDRGVDAIICICVSSQVSSTYSSAVTACEHFPERRIQVVDSYHLSMAQGFLVLEAAEMAATNDDEAAIVAHLEEIKTKLHTFAMLPTLKYLVLSGRANKFVAGLADTFNIKPILVIKDGRLNLIGKVRTNKKAMERLLELLGDAVKNKRIERLAVIHVNNPQGAAEMEVALRSLFSCPPNITIAELTAGLSIYTGAGMIGVVVQTE